MREHCTALIFIRPDLFVKEQSIKVAHHMFHARLAPTENVQFTPFCKPDPAAKTNSADFYESRIDLWCTPAHFCHLRLDWLSPNFVKPTNIWLRSFFLVQLCQSSYCKPIFLTNLRAHSAENTQRQTRIMFISPVGASSMIRASKQGHFEQMS